MIVATALSRRPAYFSIWKDLTEYLAAEFDYGGGLGEGHLAQNVTPEMVSSFLKKNFEKKT